MNHLEKEVIKAIDNSSDEIIATFKELIQTPSLSGSEEKLARLISSKLDRYGFNDHLIDDAGNVIASINSNGNENLLLYSHMDHAPPGNMSEPYSAQTLDGQQFGVDGEVIWGRGTCDTKGSLCAMLMACKTILDLDISLAGTLTFASVVMEELGGSYGIKNLLKRHTFTTAIIGEPTELKIAYGQRGGVFLHFKVKGSSGHVGRSEEYTNAFEKSIDVITQIKEEIGSKLEKDPILGNSVLSFTNVKVNPGFVSIIPDECLVEFDLRYTTKYTPDQIIAEIAKCISKMQTHDPDLVAEVDYMKGRHAIKGNEYREDIPPFYTPLDTDQVIAAQKTLKEILQREPETFIWPFATDGGFIAKKGIVTFGLGPGDCRIVHSEKEYVKLDDILLATKMYALLAINLLKST